MSKAISVNFSHSLIPGIELHVSSSDEMPKGDTSCRITIRKGEMGSTHQGNTHFWNCVRVITRSLDVTPDHINIRPAEIGRGEHQGTISWPNGWGPCTLPWNYPNSRNNRVECGGEDALIEHIRYENLGTVANKTLREMRAIGLIGEQDYESAIGQLSAQGINAKPYNTNRHDGPYFVSGSEREPSYKHSGQHLEGSTQRYLQEKAPFGAGRPDGVAEAVAYANLTRN